ncbi:hypothetical protein GR138_12075 [Shinella kummerowiae]|jgi:hypothetical protein|uniref:Sialate O-acetylesterase domain-containing protein n=1 Tax=Shinella kummerowiae TaxID=417745 RepID=A0A6N8SB72_9HYPH|nr:hypothetical protein [Shinella kummerowiae]MXN45931.1 hypothetical protein [Shinella kummerowiae]
MGTVVTDVIKSVFADGPNSNPDQVDKARVRSEVGPTIDSELDKLRGLSTVALQWKVPVTLATSANITLSGEQTVDGVMTSSTDVLVKDHASGVLKGIYTSGAGAWTRRADANEAAELVGMAVFVRSGTVNAGKQFACTTPAPITIGATALTFVEISDQAALNAGIADLEATKADTTYVDAQIGAIEERVPDAVADSRYAHVVGDPSGAVFYGIDYGGYFLADLTKANALSGINPLTDASFVIASGTKDDTLAARLRNGVPADFGIARMPLTGIEPIGGMSKAVSYSPDGTRRVLSGPDFEYFGGQPAYGKSMRCYAPRPLYGAGRIVCVACDGSGIEIPDDPDTIYMLLGTGQSLMAGSNGTDAYFYTTALYPSHTLMFQSSVYSDFRMGLAAADITQVLDGNTLTGFTPAVARVGRLGYGGQDILTSAANYMQRMAMLHCGKTFPLLIASVAVGGASQAEIGPGTVPWTNGLTAVARATAIAASMGKRLCVLAVVRSHGQTDATTPAQTYADNEIDHMNQLSTAIKAITGQVGDVPWMVDQWSSMGEASDNESTSNSVIGITLAEQDQPTKYMISTPHYRYKEFYSPDFVHFLGRGYAQIGEKVGHAILTRLVGNTGKKALRFSSAVYDGNVTITATANRAADDFLIDTTLVTAQTNHGIEVSYGSGQFRTISNVARSGNTAVITLSAPIAGAHMLGVGMLGHDTTRTLATVPRTNFRDASTKRALLGNIPDPDVMLHQRIPVTMP